MNGMTKEQIAKALLACGSPDIGCEDCPFMWAQEGCREKLIRSAADYIKRTAIHTNAKLESAPGAIGEIMSHYQKPLVTISFQEMEE